MGFVGPLEEVEGPENLRGRGGVVVKNVPRSKERTQEEVVEIVPRSKWDVGLQVEVVEIVP